MGLGGGSREGLQSDTCRHGEPLARIGQFCTEGKVMETMRGGAALALELCCSPGVLPCRALGDQQRV